MQFGVIPTRQKTLSADFYELSLDMHSDGSFACRLALLDDLPLAEFGDSWVYIWPFLWAASPGEYKCSAWRKAANAEFQIMEFLRQCQEFA